MSIFYHWTIEKIVEVYDRSSMLLPICRDQVPRDASVHINGSGQLQISLGHNGRIWQTEVVCKWRMLSSRALETWHFGPNTSKTRNSSKRSPGPRRQQVYYIRLHGRVVRPRSERQASSNNYPSPRLIRASGFRQCATVTRTNWR